MQNYSLNVIFCATLLLTTRPCISLFPFISTALAYGSQSLARMVAPPSSSHTTNTTQTTETTQTNQASQTNQATHTTIGINQGGHTMNMPETAAALKPIVSEALRAANPQQPVILNINMSGQSTESASNTQEQKHQAPRPPERIDLLKEIAMPTPAVPAALPIAALPTAALPVRSAAPGALPTAALPAVVTVPPVTAWYKRFHLLPLAGGLVGTYALMQTYLWYIAFKLSDCTWSEWRKSLSLEELFSFTQSDLAKELLHSIKAHYAHIMDYASTNPVTLFFKQAEEELQLLKRYQLIANYLNKARLSSIFFYNSELLSSIKDRIQRLQFIKGSFAASLPASAKADLKAI